MSRDANGKLQIVLTDDKVIRTGLHVEWVLKALQGIFLRA